MLRRFRSVRAGVRSEAVAAMREPRFVVSESSGYPIHHNAPGMARYARPVTEVMVLDRAYCHKVVWSSLTTLMERNVSWPRKGRNGQPIQPGTKRYLATALGWSLDRRRRYAADLAARLNAEHR